MQRRRVGDIEHLRPCGDCTFTYSLSSPYSSTSSSSASSSSLCSSTLAIRFLRYFSSLLVSSTVCMSPSASGGLGLNRLNMTRLIVLLTEYYQVQAMRNRCAPTDTDLISIATWSAWWQQNTLSETLSSPLEGRQTPWFSSGSSSKRTTHLFHRPYCSSRIHTSCAARKSPTSPGGCASTRNHRKSFGGSALLNNWSSVQRNSWAVGSPPKDWKLATGTSIRLNWVARIPLMHRISAVGIVRSYLSY